MHVVASGETPFSIARRYDVSVEALLLANGISDPTKVEVGRRLIVPGAVRPRVEGTVIPPRAERSTNDREEEPPTLPSPPAPDLASMRASIDRSPEAGRSPMIWPVDGVVVSLFGSREGSRHDGIDIGAPEGTAVWAAAAGRVVFAGEQPGYGKLVIVAHPGELVTIYAHNAENLVKSGDEVRQGDPIAQVGRSGDQPSPALHFEVRDNRVAVNPLQRLPK